MKKTTNATATTATTRKTVGLGNTNTATTQTPKGVSAKYEDLLGCMKYNRDGGMNVPSNAWHDDHYYCEAVEVVKVTADGKTKGLGRNPYEQFCYSVAKKWRTNADYLPDAVRAPSEHEEHFAIVSKTLVECLENGTPNAEIVGKCYKALDAKYRVHEQDTHKTLEREECEWNAHRAFVATLFSGDLSTVGGTAEDLTEDSPYGSLTLEESEQLERLVKLFNSVKEAHKYATPEKWLCAQCYALNMPTEAGIEKVYGVAIKTAKRKSVHSCRVKYSRHANEVFGWILNEVEKNPDGFDKWAAVLDRCKATAEAEITLEECAIEFDLAEDVVKHLRSHLNALPYEVLRYCEAVKAKHEA